MYCCAVQPLHRCSSGVLLPRADGFEQFYVYVFWGSAADFIFLFQYTVSWWFVFFVYFIAFDWFCICERPLMMPTTWVWPVPFDFYLNFCLSWLQLSGCIKNLALKYVSSRFGRCCYMYKAMILNMTFIRIDNTLWEPCLSALTDKAVLIDNCREMEHSSLNLSFMSSSQ